MLDNIRRVTENKTRITILLYKFNIFPYFEFHGQVLLPIKLEKSTEKKNTVNHPFDSQVERDYIHRTSEEGLCIILNIFH